MESDLQVSGKNTYVLAVSCRFEEKEKLQAWMKLLSGMKTIGLVVMKKFLEMFCIEGRVKLFSFVNFTVQGSTSTYYKLHNINLSK